MVSCDDIREEFSDFYDDRLDTDDKKRVAAHLGTCPRCSMEYRSFVRTLEVIRAIPAEQPVIDMWAEFAPQMDAYEAEQKFTLRERVRRWWLQIAGRISEGAILYTDGLAQRTTRRFSKYLTHNPFSAKDR
ncbi:MAG TPA: zf-HC2 domain-containing protein [Capsulimonadaceae bacterium]|jgi:anti-sigma factor RsiW